MASPLLNVLFRVAAGLQLGFGHLARSRSLAKALGVPMLVSVRGSLRTCTTASSLGWSLVEASSDISLDARHLDLIVVDDPNRDEAVKWVRKARRIGVPVASVHDLGLAIVDSDLVIDGSISPVASTITTPALRGPSFAILDPAVARLRAEGRLATPARVLIALGGGIHVYPMASRLSRALAERLPELDLHVAGGFAPPRQLPALARGSWITAPGGLAAELAEASIAIVAGGVTLYEACALRVPVIAMPVTASQHVSTRAFALRGAALDAGWPATDHTIDRVADAVVALLGNPRLAQRLSQQAAQLIDGDGVFRVADRLRQLAHGQAMEVSDAA